MPSVSASAASTTTWSRIVMTGNRDAVGRLRSRGRSTRGRSFPGTRRARSGTRRRSGSVSTGLPGPTMSFHHPASRCPGPGGPGRVTVAGERVQHQHRVVARRVQRPPGLVRDGHRREVATRFEDVRARLEERHELPASRRVTLAPGAGDGNDRRGRHAPVTLRALRRRGSPPPGRPGCPRATRCRSRAARGRA